MCSKWVQNQPKPVNSPASEVQCFQDVLGQSGMVSRLTFPHNPKVGGSNPAPAIDEIMVQPGRIRHPTVCWRWLLYTAEDAKGRTVIHESIERLRLTRPLHHFSQNFSALNRTAHFAQECDAGVTHAVFGF